MTISTPVTSTFPKCPDARGAEAAQARAPEALPGAVLRKQGACRTCPVRRTGFCGTLPRDLRRRLSALAVPAVHGANHWLWDPDGDTGPVTVLRSGYLRLLRYSEDGRRLITGIAGPGAVVGEFLSRRSHYEVECATEVSLCSFNRAAFEHLAEGYPELRRAIRQERSRSLDALYAHIWMRGLQTPEERLAAFLVRASDMLPYQPLPGGGGVMTLVVPRADIADLIGTTRETISRLTHRWQEEGLVTIPDTTHLILHDRARLAQRGGVSPALLPKGPRQTADTYRGDRATRDSGTARKPAHLHYL